MHKRFCRRTCYPLMVSNAFILTVQWVSMVSHLPLKMPFPAHLGVWTFLHMLTDHRCFFNQVRNFISSRHPKESKKKTSYKPRWVICHTHNWRRMGVKNTYKRRKTHLLESGQAFPRKSSVIAVSHTMCLCSQHQLVTEWSLVLTQRYKALSFASSEISQKRLLLPPLPSGEFIWVQKMFSQE